MNNIPLGLCQCGCGQRTKIIKNTDIKRKRTKGDPQKFVKGHYRKPIPAPIYEDRGYITPCLIFKGGLFTNGYGHTSESGKDKLAHVVAYENEYGPIPPEHDVHHKCEQKDCIEPSHLKSLTKLEHRRMHRQPIKLSWEKVKYIRSSDKLGVELAKEFQVSKTVIYNIRNNKIWRESS